MIDALGEDRDKVLQVRWHNRYRRRLYLPDGGLDDRVARRITVARGEGDSQLSLVSHTAEQILADPQADLALTARPWQGASVFVSRGQAQHAAEHCG